jgi:hypothetical protein
VKLGNIPTGNYEVVKSAFGEEIGISQWDI